MRWLYGMLLAVGAAAVGLFVYAQWTSRPRSGAVFAWETNEPALDEFSRGTSGTLRSNPGVWPTSTKGVDRRSYCSMGARSMPFNGGT
jgi:hypothetical protein